MASRDYYAILGVSQTATPDEIKKAYRKLARELHPDINPSAEAQERFKEVTAAYEVLSDPQKRQMLDLGGDPLSASGGAGAAGPFGGFADIMDAFFGGASGMGSRGPRSRVQPGADALIRIELDLADTAFGTTRDITPRHRGAVHEDATAQAPLQVRTPRPARPAAVAARCSRCSGRCSARSSRHVRVRTAVASARRSATRVPTAPATAGCGRVVPSPSRCRPGSRTACGCGSPAKVRSAPAVDRRVTCTSRYASVTHPSFVRDGDDLHCKRAGADDGGSARD